MWPRLTFLAVWLPISCPFYVVVVVVVVVVTSFELTFISVAELKAEAAKIELDQELSSQEEVSILYSADG